MTIFGVFSANHSVESSLHQNKPLGYSGLRPSALASRKETIKWKNGNLK